MPPQSPPTMHAYTTTTHLTLSTPLPFPHQVLIRIHSTSLSRGTIILSLLFAGFLPRCPSIAELDFSGVVVCVGEDAMKTRGRGEDGDGDEGGFVVGDYVFGSIPVSQHLGGVGALAEYVAVDTCQIAHVPETGLKAPGAQQLAEAAALPVSGCTALSLLHAAKLETGMSVLVNGASGGVGSLILQLVKHAVGESGRVTAVCSQKNVEMVKEVGADEVVPYDAPSTDFGIGGDLVGVCTRRATELGISDGRFDVVIDAVGRQEIWHRCTSILKEKGAYVTVGPEMEAWTRMALLKTLGQMAGNMLRPSWAGGVARRYIQVASTVDKKGLLELKKLVEDGVLKGVVEKTFGWHAADIAEAYEIMLSRRARGKLLIKVGHSVD